MSEVFKRRKRESGQRDSLLSGITDKRVVFGVLLLGVLNGCGAEFSAAAPDAGGNGGNGGVGGVAAGGADAGLQGGSGGKDGGPDGGAGGGPDGGGCPDNPVQLHFMAKYGYKAYRGGCDDVHTIYSSVNEPQPQYETGITDLCLKADDIVMVQVNDYADANSFEFSTESVPQKMEVNVDQSGSEMHNLDFNAMCAQSAGFMTYDVVTDDKNPYPNNYKYNGNLYSGNLPPSNLFRYKP